MSDAAKAELGKMPEWNLNDLYPGTKSPELTSDLEKAASEAIAFQTDWQGKLEEIASGDEGGKKLAEIIQSYETMADRIGRIGSYSGLLYAGNNEDPETAKFYGDTQEKLTDIYNSLLFFELEFNRIDDGIIDKALESAELAHYRPWLDDLRKEKPYQLSDELEKLFHEKSITGRGAWNRLFNETMTSLRFEVDGEELALEAALNLLTDKDGDKRRKGAEAISKVLGENIRLFALITNTLSKDVEISNRWRGFKDIADSRHLGNRVEKEVVDALETAVREAYPRLSHRYYAIKAKWFGLEKLDFWDRNAPLPNDANRVYSWSEARETVLGAYKGFAPEMAQIAEPFFDKGWIDAPVRQGKTPGAFSHPTVPSAHPYILLNYLGKPRDVMTLAHELGHGIHQVLAADQGALMAQTPLTLAETASVFGEMLTFRALLEKAKTPAERKVMIAGKVEDMINTVVRQIAFYTFERKLHTERRTGELTAERIGELWMSVQEESLGPAIRLHKGYENYWSYIPHFIHSPFYVYAYAFGDCLVNSLYAVYQNAEEGFAEKYFDMLRAGGSKHHKELLAPFGLDASDPAFWGKGLSMIEGLIDELEEMEAAE
jgi:oligoendopeptidase F